MEVSVEEYIINLTEELDMAKRHYRTIEGLCHDEYIALLEREIRYFRTMLYKP